MPNAVHKRSFTKASAYRPRRCLASLPLTLLAKDDGFHCGGGDADKSYRAAAAGTATVSRSTEVNA
jgi:hypothetical protein